MSLSISRRHLLQFLSLTCLTGGFPRNYAKADPIQPLSEPHQMHTHPFSILVGGPENSRIGQWATSLSSFLAPSLHHHTPLPLFYTLGLDSVTAANRFDSHLVQNDNMAFITSGAPLIAALAANQRVHFHYERWIPIMTALSPIITLVRPSVYNDLPEFSKNRIMKVGISTLSEKELPTLLALDLLKFQAQPITGISSYPLALEALKNRQIDLLQIDSQEGFIQLPQLLQEGFRIFFSFDEHDDPHIPSFNSLYMKQPDYQAHHPLYELWKTLKLAAQIEFALVLPMLTPSEMVAQWRLNTNRLFQRTDFMKTIQDHHLVLKNDRETIQIFTNIIPSPSKILTLKNWLSSKHPDWQ